MENINYSDEIRNYILYSTGSNYNKEISDYVVNKIIEKAKELDKTRQIGQIFIQDDKHIQLYDSFESYVYFTIKSKTEKVNTETQLQYKTKENKQVSENVRLLIIALIYHIQRKNIIIREDSNTKSTPSYKIPDVALDLSACEDSKLSDILLNFFSEDDFKKLDIKEIIKQIKKGSSSGPRTLDNWEVRFNKYLCYLLFPNSDKDIPQEHKPIILREQNTKPTLELKTLSEFPKPNIEKHQECLSNTISLNDSSLDRLSVSQLKGRYLMVSPTQGGKTHVLKEWAISDNHFIYIDLRDMQKVQVYEPTKYVSNSVLSKKRLPLEPGIFYSNADLINSIVFLFDNIDLLPVDQQIQFVYQISLLPNSITATTYWYPQVFSSLQPNFLYIAPKPIELKMEYVTQNKYLSTKQVNRLMELPLLFYPGAMINLDQTYDYRFDKIVSSLYNSTFADFMLDDTDLITVLIKRKLVQELGTNSFSSLITKDGQKFSQNLFSKFDELIKDFHISLLDDEEKKLIDSPNIGCYSKLIRIVEHQLEFQSIEFLWVTLSRIMASNDQLGDFIAAYSGYQYSQSSSWAFFLDYYDSYKANM